MGGIRQRKDESPEEFEARKAEAEAAAPQDRAPRQTVSRRVQHKAIEAGVGFLNGVVGMVQPAFALTVGERKPAELSVSLQDDDEFTTLVNALDSYQGEHATFRKYLGRFCTFTDQASLLGVVALLIYRRYLMLQAAKLQALQTESQGPTVYQNGYPETNSTEHVRPPDMSPFEPETPAWVRTDGAETPQSS